MEDVKEKRNWAEKKKGKRKKVKFVEKDVNTLALKRFKWLKNYVVSDEEDSEENI